MNKHRDTQMFSPHNADTDRQGRSPNHQIAGHLFRPGKRLTNDIAKEHPQQHNNRHAGSGGDTGIGGHSLKKNTDSCENSNYCVTVVVFHKMC